ncbi:MAG: hypothetical protein HRU24_00050 [Gammaproteobacteria bacterium]|nr:hypothetical protein [Gammaproteobacteria bacterium]
MRNLVEKIEILKQVAMRLGAGWIYNETLSKDSRFLILSNGAGLYIEIQFVYGEILPQWKLCYRNPKYINNFPKVNRIGCSFEKSTGQIAADVSTRLLSKTSAAYEALTAAKNTYIYHQNLLTSRKQVIASISKMLSVEPCSNHGRDSYNLLDNEDYKIGSFEHLHDRVDKFNLHLRGVTAADVIKIMFLLK